MNLDFVIHPTFAENSLNSNPIWHQYLEDILQQVSGNECVILLKPKTNYYNNHKLDFEKKLNAHYIFNTEIDHHQIEGSRMVSHEDTGFIVQEELEKLSKIVTQPFEHQIKIHGSYLGYCLSEFVLQLYYLQILQKELTSSKFREKWFSEEKNVVDEPVNFWKYAPKMPKNYNWGVVFTIPQGLTKIHLPGTNDPNKRINFPFGSIEYQLLCPQTKLYTLAPPNYTKTNKPPQVS